MGDTLSISSWTAYWNPSRRYGLHAADLDEHQQMFVTVNALSRVQADTLWPVLRRAKGVAALDTLIS